jgi:hypothetical protein
LQSCVGNAFVEDFVLGRKRHMCFERRQDVKILFRDMSTRNPRKKDPVPKFFLEAIYRDQKKRAPGGHFKGMLNIFIKDVGGSDNDVYAPNKAAASHDDDDERREEPQTSRLDDDVCCDGNNIFRSKHDIDPMARRLVLWPNQDYICNHEGGIRFFQHSVNTEFETIDDCGHAFHSDGTFIFDLVRERVIEYLLDDFAPSSSHRSQNGGSSPIMDSGDGF